MEAVTVLCFYLAWELGLFQVGEAPNCEAELVDSGEKTDS